MLSTFKTGFVRPPFFSAQAGHTLMIVLVFIALLQMLAVACLQKSLINTKTAANMNDKLYAIQAAETGLTLCIQRLGQAHAPVVSSHDHGIHFWQNPQSFDGSSHAAFDLAIYGQENTRPPQCLIQTWPTPPISATTAYLITVRGWGRIQETQAWHQALILFEGEKIRTHWRSIAARPY